MLICNRIRMGISSLVIVVESNFYLCFLSQGESIYITYIQRLKKTCNLLGLFLAATFPSLPLAGTKRL